MDAIERIGFGRVAKVFLRWELMGFVIEVMVWQVQQAMVGPGGGGHQGGVAQGGGAVFFIPADAFS